ncbi:hypothetical protein L6452_19564 [Arctium lappa]|uniref:Uncharacterized protein n=1 Tax=Arctium lappa TaxID=4217 RepID=A0ACB9B8I4_ARCLA|nr:hypothetical protein L6452_19564 [Arctium lappa]
MFLKRARMEKTQQRSKPLLSLLDGDLRWGGATFQQLQVVVVASAATSGTIMVRMPSVEPHMVVVEDSKDESLVGPIETVAGGRERANEEEVSKKWS